VKLAITTAAVAGGMLLACFAAGCSTSSGSAGGTPQASVPGCTAYGVYAIEHHITVTQTPAACEGLSKTEVNQAAARAIMQVAGGVRKAIWRKRASEAAPFLAHLFSTPPPVTNSLPALAAGSAATGPLGARNLGMDTAALIVWLVTAGSGAYVLGSWLAHGGSLRRRAGGTGAPPAVIFGHFGLALTGLVIWIVYMVAGWAALAWTAVGVLLPVAGLGMATLAVGLPGLPSLPGLSGRPVPAVAGSAPAGSSTGGSVPGGSVPGGSVPGGSVPGGSVAGGSVPGGADTGSTAGTGNTATDGPGRAASAKRRLSPLIVVGHGVVAVTTMLLVLLAALGVGLG
jgi:hypothetical protein